LTAAYAWLADPTGSKSGSASRAVLSGGKSGKELWPFSSVAGGNECKDVFLDLGAFDGNTVEAWFQLEHFFTDELIGSRGNGPT
jgi:hypothetical protein